MKASDYVTAKELATHAGVHLNTIARWRRAGLLTGWISSRHQNGVGRTTLYPLSALRRARDIQRLSKSGYAGDALTQAVSERAYAEIRERAEPIRRRADLVATIREFVSLEPTSAGGYKARCPFHSEKTPSFHVDPHKGFFHCFGCNRGGNVFKFFEYREQVSYEEAILIVAGRVGAPPREILRALGL